MKMKIDKSAAAIDTDFMLHLAETDIDVEKLQDLFSIFFKELMLHPVMHPLVYEHEVLPVYSSVAYLFENGIIQRLAFDDIFCGEDSEAKRTFYKSTVVELYKELKGDDISAEDIFTYWRAKRSLGEIHSVAMCLTCGCGIFLSDDGDSKHLKKIVETRVLGNITVHNRKEACKKLKSMGTSLNSKVLHAFSHK